MRKNFITAAHEGKLVLKSVKLTQPLVKPIITSGESEEQTEKKTIITQLINKFKNNKT